jgi:uncharacterized protein YdeI (YjbR/CyaY-like superfamily)
MNPRTPEVTARIRESKQWKREFEELRAIVLGCELTEALKWEQPCYTFEGSNIVLIHGFKEYCALLFFKGALMRDPHNILIQQTENVQAGRQVRFTNLQEIVRLKPILTAYVQEAIAVEKAGLQVEYKKTGEYEIPDELQDAFDANLAFRNAFEALTPGRQRGYILYFTAPKQSKTRELRIEKCTDLIFDGFGLRDEYNQSTTK